MKYSPALLATALLAGGSAAAAVKRGTPSFAGGNNYYIHATATDVQDAWVQQLTDNGAKVARLWVTGTYDGCVKGSSTSYMVDVEPSLGEYHDDSLNALDNLLTKLHAAGIKAIISPHNGNNLAGANCNNDPYCPTWGDGAFYTNSDAKAAYDARLAYILNFQSPNFGKPWSQLSEAILAFDVQNEPFITAAGLAADNDASDWLCGRAGNMAKLTNGSGVKIATGGIAGSQYDGNAHNLMPKAVQCSAVDIISMHSYLTATQWGEFIPSSLDSVGDKHLMIEEFGVGNTDGGNVDPNEFQGIVNLFDGAGVPWVYWEIIPAADQSQECSDACCHQSFDGFEYGPGSTKGGITMTQAIGEANSASAAQDWTGFVF